MLQEILRTSKKTVGQARSLRKRSTPGEQVLWRKLRARRFHGLKFRRQAPLGRYIVDFLCVEKKLIIEIDGYSHSYLKAKLHDQKRERFLREKGFHVLRFSNSDTVDSVESVLSNIMEYLNHSP